MTKRTSTVLLLASMAVGLLWAAPVRAQAPYFQAVTNLHPVGYWPLHEVAAPAPGDIETNYGTLRLLGTGYYPDWVAGGASLIARGFPGALAGDSDPAVYFTFPTSNGGGVTNSLYVPHTSPLSILNPPFSVECWFYPTNNNQGDVWSQCGYEGLNVGGSGGGAGAVNGTRLYWNGPGFIVYAYYNSSTLNNLMSYSAGVAVGQWYHVVVTCDADTNFTMSVNASLVRTKGAVGLYAPDYWTPFQVGNGRGNTRAVKGIVDEVAVYTNVLADVDVHYAAGTNTSPSPTYFQVVTNDNPVIYFRMNGPTYTAPAASTWPVLVNYGSVGANGVYTPGTIPGLLPGPATPTGAPFNGLSGTNVAQFSGVSSFADAGYAAAYNPTGAVPFTVAAMFRGNPTDNRVQDIVGHSDNSWRLWLNASGKLQFQLGNAATASGLTSVGGYNDGQWHQAVGVYTPASNPNGTGTNALYVDGVLETSVTTVSTNGIGPGSPLNVLIASDPQYTNNPNGVGRQFAGQVCEVALFTNALTASQIQSLYGASGVQLPPSIIAQPTTGRTVNGGPGTYITFGVAAQGSLPLAYQWYFNASSNYNGATRLVNGTKYLGTTTSLLTVSNLDDPNSGYYFVVVTNNLGSVTSELASLTVYSGPTIISQIPVTYTNRYTLYAGASPTFSITSVKGAPPIYYQWYSNGVAVPGATNTTFGLTNVQVGGVTNYCVLSNFVGVATSFVWAAQVVLPPTAPYPQSVLALRPIGYWRLNEPDDTLSDGNPGIVAHDYRGGNDGVYTNCNLGQTGYSLGLATQYGNPALGTDPATTSASFGFFTTPDSGALGIVGIDFSSPSNTSRAFSIAAWVNGGGQGTDAGLVTKGYGGGGEQFDLDTGSDTLASHGFRFFVRNAAGTGGFANSAITPDGNWHHLVGVCDQPNGVVTLYVDGLAAASGPFDPGGGIKAANDPMSIGTRRQNSTSTYNIQFAGNINDVAIYNYALSAAQVASNYISAGVAPQISQQPPATVDVSEGGTLTITAAGQGTPPLFYRWQNITAGTTVAGQTNATLVISNVTAAMSGNSFGLTVSNLYGAASSAYATVNVISGPPQITASNLLPQVLLPLGKSFTYSVQVSGTTPFNYQWSNGGHPVTGGTNANYTVAGTALGTSTIGVVITNNQGMASGTSVLTVIPVPTDPLATAVLSLHPVGYWPLQETNAPAPVTMETNYGTLGKVGNAYYAMNAVASPRVTFGASGALGNAGDPDPAVSFTGPSGTNYAFVPHTLPQLTLRPPLSMEAWIYSGGTAFADIMGQGGNGANTPAGGSGQWGGIRLSYGGSSGGASLQAYAYTGGANTFNSFGTPAASMPLNQWHHCAMTFDGAQCILYVDGQPGATNSSIAAMVPDVCSPFTIGDARWLGDSGSLGPTRPFNGTIDEVAVYTNALTAARVAAHYTAANTSGANYMQTVLADKPLLYYRMDAPGYVTTDPATYPTAVNYGSAPVNGAYPGGVPPGAVTGPSIAGLSTSLAAPVNGVVSCVDANNDPAFNPTGGQPFSSVLWFRAYPSDGRAQALMSHGVQGWAMNLDGSTGRVVWNLYSGGQVTSTNILNDGAWHMVAGVFDGTTGYLYVDGVLNNSGTATGGLTGEPGADLFLGGNADFTGVGLNQRFFAGAVAQAAFFTNALSPAQISYLNNPASAAPTISIARSGSQIIITYSGTLLSATNVTGSYLAVPGASPPSYTTSPASGGRTFYRTSQ